MCRYATWNYCKHTEVPGRVRTRWEYVAYTCYLCLYPVEESFQSASGLSKTCKFVSAIKAHCFAFWSTQCYQLKECGLLLRLNDCFALIRHKPHLYLNLSSTQNSLYPNIQRSQNFPWPRRFVYSKLPLLQNLTNPHRNIFIPNENPWLKSRW